MQTLQEETERIIDENLARTRIMRQFAERMGREYFVLMFRGEWNASAQVWKSFATVVYNECDYFHQKEFWATFSVRAGGK